jgi:hypothetical protein
LDGWEVGVGIALLGHQLPADLGRAEPRIPAVRAELGIGLTLAVDNGLDLRAEVGQMIFSPLASTRGDVVLQGAPTLKFAGALPNGNAAPAAFPFRASLPPWPEFFDRAGHKEPAGTPFERLGRVDKERCERVGEVHVTVSHA